MDWLGLAWIGLDWSVEGEEKTRKEKNEGTAESRPFICSFMHPPMRKWSGDGRERRILAHIKRDQ